MAAVKAFGATITFSSGWFGCITSIDWTGVERAAFDVSCFDAGTPGANIIGNMSWIPSGLSNSGQLEIAGHYYLGTQARPPIDSVAEAVTVTFVTDGAGGTSTLTGSGFLTAFNMTGPIDDAIGYTATLKWAGGVTITV